MVAVDDVLDLAIAKLLTPPDEVMRGLGAPRDRLPAEPVCVRRCAARPLCDATHVLAERQRDLSRRLPYVDPPREVEAAVEVDLDPRELVVLLLLERKTQVVAGHEEAPSPIDEEALVGIPPFGTGCAPM